MVKRVHWTERQLEMRLKIARKVGEAVGAEKSAAHFTQVSLDKWEAREDEDARRFRELASYFDKVANARREEQAQLEAEYEREFPHGDIDPRLEVA